MMPPLPPAGHTRPGYIYNADNEICGHALPILYYTPSQMREYGQACRTDLVALVQAVHKAKGRYHSQIAMCDLYDACGLPNTRLTK